jgi:glyoxylase-like metal-dependent hydrolase (beta-lactamase superfamily II)
MESVQVERFYLGCLAHASYFISSGTTAAVVDPQRDVEIYLEAAARKGVRIEHVIETHLHADFISGHLELAERTGARIYLGKGLARLSYTRLLEMEIRLSSARAGWNFFKLPATRWRASAL